ncbi:hypothetical protein OROMI_034984 [Orobanche minor]
MQSMEHQKTKENPWKREVDRKVARHTLGVKEENKYNLLTQKSGAKSFRGGRESRLKESGELLSLTTGTIIECIKQVDGTHSSTITSATLLGSHADADDIEVDIYVYDGTAFVGHVFAHDLHYNLALLNVRSDRPLPTVTLRLLDESISIDPMEIVRPPGNKLQLRPHSNLFSISPGDLVIAIGRLDLDSRLMVAPGEFSIDCSLLDCKELLRTSCRISMCGIGGPLINRFGEVIGINFMHDQYTPFLPTNIVSKWLMHFKEQGRFRRPWLGMQVSNLYAAPPTKLEFIIQNFPNIFKGVIVESVTPGSSADSAGILPDDVIVQCNNDIVHVFLEVKGEGEQAVAKEDLENY